jgi:23S rRNA (cytidine1920-2'-O)/16S rRNA (cytidine1409-2'-O)-methyltransferase
MKIRIDKLLVDRELASSLKEALAILMAGEVLVDNVPVVKAGTLVEKNSIVRLKSEKNPYVSRGGIKLAHALKEFKCKVKGMICLDVGASTGGFTDCLLQNGAAKVYAVDVGYGQLARKIATDPRVIIIDRQNVRFLKKEQVPDPVDLAVIDVSFISLKLVFLSVDKFLKRDGSVIALVKPQFEVRREFVAAGGVVKDQRIRELAVEKVIRAGKDAGWHFRNFVESPIEGPAGNREYFALFKKS